MKKQLLIAIAAFSLAAPLAAQTGSSQQPSTTTTPNQGTMNQTDRGNMNHGDQQGTMNTSRGQNLQQRSGSSSGFLRREPRQIYRASDLEEDRNDTGNSMQQQGSIQGQPVSHNPDWFRQDLNGDGTLDEQEWSNVTGGWNDESRDQWSAYDLDGDGMLTDDERETARSNWNTWAAEQRTVYDADGDGRLNDDELTRMRDATANDLED